MEAELACSAQWFHQQSPSHHRPNIIPAQITLGRSIVTCLALDTTVSYPDADSNCLISLEASTLAPRWWFSTKSPKWSFKTWSQSYCFLFKNPPEHSHHRLSFPLVERPGSTWPRLLLWHHDLSVPIWAFCSNHPIPWAQQDPQLWLMQFSLRKFFSHLLTSVLTSSNCLSNVTHPEEPSSTSFSKNLEVCLRLAPTTLPYIHVERWLPGNGVGLPSSCLLPCSKGNWVKLESQAWRSLYVRWEFCVCEGSGMEREEYLFSLPGLLDTRFRICELHQKTTKDLIRTTLKY